MEGEKTLNAVPSGPETGSEQAQSAIKAFTSSVHAFISGAADLLATESRLAGLSLARMLALSIGLGLLAVTMWLCVVAAIVTWFATHAYLWPVAFLGAALVNAIGAYGVWRWIIHLSRNLSFQALRENLSADPVFKNNHSGEPTCD